MRWFGESWGAPVCELNEWMPTPVDAVCEWCEEPIGETDQGVALGDDELVEFTYEHRECFLRAILGSLPHLRGECSCYDPGSEEGDPPELTRREAALAAVAYWQERGPWPVRPLEEMQLWQTYQTTLNLN